MRIPLRIRLLGLSILLVSLQPAATADAAMAPAWVEPMKKVHAKFTGTRGTFALFGDSITVSLAFWAPLAGEAKGLSADAERAHKRVKAYLKPECWYKWRGPAYGNEGSTTVRWAHANVDKWLKKLNPETALIMFGTNDLGQVPAREYEEKLRDVVDRCLRNGTVVILSTIPPRSGRLEQCRQFAAIVRKVARARQVPLVDYFAEVLRRRPDDWDGTLAKFKNTSGGIYQVPTLISGDGVHPSNPQKYRGFSEEALRHNGFGLRSYLTLMAYAEVIERVLRANAR